MATSESSSSDVGGEFGMAAAAGESDEALTVTNPALAILGAEAGRCEAPMDMRPTVVVAVPFSPKA